MGKIKKNKEKRTKNDVNYRTKDERQSEVMNIIKQISEFELTTEYEPIKQLYVLFREYINEDKRIEVNIPFPMINRRIKGVLAISVNEKVWIKLESEI